MELKDDIEKILYWIYKAPRIFLNPSWEDYSNIQIQDLIEMMKVAGSARNPAKNKDGTQAWEAFQAFCKHPFIDWILIFRDLELLECNFDGHRARIKLLEKNPWEIIRIYRRKKIEDGWILDRLSIERD